MDVNKLRFYAKDKYAKALSKKERDALYNYTLDSYDVNESLRSDRALNKKERMLVKQLDSALDKFVLPKSIILYRKIDMRSYDNAYKLIKQWEKDGNILDKGYMSTCITDYGYNNFFNIMLFIEFPKTAKGAYINDFAYFDEDEFLIARDTTMDVLDINYTYNRNIESEAFIVKTKVRG